MFLALSSTWGAFVGHDEAVAEQWIVQSQYTSPDKRHGLFNSTRPPHQLVLLHSAHTVSQTTLLLLEDTLVGCI